MVLRLFETLLALRVISVPAVNKPMVSSNVFPAFAITAEEIPRFFAISAELTANEFDTSLLFCYLILSYKYRLYLHLIKGQGTSTSLDVYSTRFVYLSILFYH